MFFYVWETILPSVILSEEKDNIFQLANNSSEKCFWLESCDSLSIYSKNRSGLWEEKSFELMHKNWYRRTVNWSHSITILMELFKFTRWVLEEELIYLDEYNYWYSYQDFYFIFRRIFSILNLIEWNKKKNILFFSFSFSFKIIVK